MARIHLRMMALRWREYRIYTAMKEKFLGERFSIGGVWLAGRFVNQGEGALQAPFTPACCRETPRRRPKDFPADQAWRLFAPCAQGARGPKGQNIAQAGAGGGNWSGKRRRLKFVPSATPAARRHLPRTCCLTFACALVRDGSTNWTPVPR